MMMDNGGKQIVLSGRGKRILQVLTVAEQPLGIYDIARQAKCSARQAFYELNLINERMISDCGKPLGRNRNVFYLLEEHKKQISEAAGYNLHIPEHDDRIAYIICKALHTRTRVTIESLQYELQISRNLIISDINSVRVILNQYGLSIKVTNKSRIVVEGDIGVRRYVFCHYCRHVCECRSFEFLRIYDEAELGRCSSDITKILGALDCCANERECLILAHLFLHIQDGPGKEQDGALSLFVQTKAYEQVKAVFGQVSERELFAFCSVIVSRTTEISLQYVEPYRQTCNTMSLVKQLVELYETEAGIAITSYRELYEVLYAQIEHARFAYHYDIPFLNMFTNEIRRKHEKLFCQLQECCGRVRFPYPICDSHIASFCIPFLCQLPVKSLDRKVNVMIVCNADSCIRQFLTREICGISDRIKLHCVLCSTNPGKISEVDGVDVIISAHRIDVQKTVINVSTFITDDEKKKIYIFVMKFLQECCERLY